MASTAPCERASRLSKPGHHLAIEHPSRWWETFWGVDDDLSQDAPPWLVSMAIHIVGLLVLAFCVAPPPDAREKMITIVAPDVPEPEPDTNHVVQLDAPEPPRPGPPEPIPFPAPLPPDPDIPDLVVFPSPKPLDDFDPFRDPIDDLDRLPEPRPGEGFPVQSGSAGEALDFLAAMIRDSAAQRPTRVCWVFDQSVSLAGQRREIASRIERILAHVTDALWDTEHHAIEHTVFAYAQTVTRVTPEPTTVAADVMGAIEMIAIDESGIENTFTAISEAVRTAAKPASGRLGKNIRVIVFTDERGNDEDLADSVSRLCIAQLAQVYVVGVPAPFGRRAVPIRFVEYDTQRFAAGEQWAEVDQGPETLFPEFVRVNAGRYDDEPMDSGFGPFSLSKLCRSTGGRYICVHANRRTDGRVTETAPMASRLTRFFDPEAMKPYQPDYAPAAMLERELQHNAAKMALVSAATLTIEPLRNPRWIFPRENDGAFAALLSEAQRQAAVLGPKVSHLHAILEQGRRDRPRIQEKRWQAGYDLALGRVLAAKARIDAYNTTLAAAKQGLRFQDPRNDTWELEPSDDVSQSGSAIEKLACQARDLLTQVVAEHPGTPWALIAAAELEAPMGYAWKETFTNVRPPPPPKGGGPVGKPADDVARPRLEAPKPPRPVRNL